MNFSKLSYPVVENLEIVPEIEISLLLTKSPDFRLFVKEYS